MSKRIYEFICELLEDDIEPQAICIGLVSHSARLGLQTNTDPTNVVGTLLPIVHQLIDEAGLSSENGEETSEVSCITHECATLQ